MARRLSPVACLYQFHHIVRRDALGMKVPVAERIEPPLLIKERLFYRQLGLPSPIDPNQSIEL